MASKHLTPREKEISKIRTLNGEKNIPAQEYFDSDNREKINTEIYNGDFDISEYITATLPDGTSTLELDNINSLSRDTERFFGFALSRVAPKLLHTLSCENYRSGKTEYTIPKASNENEIDRVLEEVEMIPFIEGLYSDDCYIDLAKKYNHWKQYSEFVDNIKSYIEEHHSDFSKLNLKSKKLYIKKLKENIITEGVGDYLDNYSLREQTKAKEVKLLELQLPNLIKPDIISNFVKIYNKYKSTVI